MKRLASIIAATAAAAAVAAAISLPAGADSGGRAPSSDELATFTSCLRTHGLAVPAGLERMGLKTWLRDHEDSAGFETAINACDRRPDGPAKAPGPVPEELIACLRDRGLTAPSTIEQLKPWIAQQHDTEAGEAALSACGFDAHVVTRARGGGCAGDKSVERAKTTRAKPSKSKDAPEL